MSDALPEVKACSYLDWSDKGAATFWRYLGALVLVVFCWQLPTAFVLVFTETSPTTYPLTLLARLVVPFAFGLASVPLVVKHVLKRPSYTSTVPVLPPRWGDLATGAGVQFAVATAVTLLLLPWSPVRYEGFDKWTDLKLFVPFLLLAVVGFGAQTALEEHLFRGFVMQATFRKSHAAWLVIGMQAVLFASLHRGNIDAFTGKRFELAPYFLFALTLGWVAWRTGSLMMPIGLHFANNFFLALFVVTKGDVIPSVAPFSTPVPSVSSAMVFAVVQSALVVSAVWFITRNRPSTRTPEVAQVESP